MKIYETSLVDLLIPNEKRELFPAIVEIKSGNLIGGVELMEDKTDTELAVYFNRPEIGLIRYHQQDYEKSLGIYLDIVKQEGSEYFHSSIGFLYFVIGEFQKSKEHLELAISFEELFYSNKNLGYHCLRKKKIKDAMSHFQNCIDIVGKTKTLIKEFNSDFKHISLQINPRLLNKVKHKIKELSPKIE